MSKYEKLEKRITELEKRPPCHCDSCKEMLRYQAAHPDRFDADGSDPTYASCIDPEPVLVWKESEMQSLLGEIKELHARMKEVYAACGESCGNSVHMHRCMIDSGVIHLHVCDDCGYTWNTAPCPPGELACDPTCSDCAAQSTPKWRRLVDEVGGETANALASVLHMLQLIAASPAVPKMCLARIVAVCEREVGDGWQAEPDPSAPFGAVMSVRVLMKEGWTPDGRPRWQGLGNATAAWLRDLTTDGES